MLSSQGWASDFGSFTSKFSWYAGSKDIPVVDRCDSTGSSNSVIQIYEEEQ